MEKGNTIVSTVYSIQLLLLYICMVLCSTVPILSIVYYRYRRHPMLKARRAEWSLVSQILFVVTMDAYGYNGIMQQNQSCSTILFVHVVLSAVTLFVHTIRCWLLLYNWNVSKALCEVQSDFNQSHGNWWLRHSYLASNKWMTIATVTVAVIHLIWWLLICVINGWETSFSGRVQYPICISPLLGQFGVQGPLVLHMLCAAYLSYATRLVVDVFQIKDELTATGSIWLYMAIPCWAIAQWFPVVMQYPNYALMMPLSVNLCGVRVLYLLAVKPLWMIYDETRSRDLVAEDTTATITSTVMFGSSTSIGFDDNGSAVIMPVVTEKRRLTTRRRQAEVGLRKMLDMNTGIASDFVQFLIKEFSVENWRFYTDVLQLRILYGGWKQSDAGLSGLQSGHLEWFRAQGAAAGSLEETINRIFAMYLAESALFEINLSCEQQKNIRRCFGPNMKLRPSCINEIPGLLCQAQDEIFDLMRTDSYMRFKNSPDFDRARLALA